MITPSGYYILIEAQKSDSWSYHLYDLNCKHNWKEPQYAVTFETLGHEVYKVYYDKQQAEDAISEWIEDVV